LIWCLVLGVATRILAAEVGGHEDLEAGAHGEQSNENGVTLGELRRVFAQVNEAGNDATEIAYSRNVSIFGRFEMHASRLTKTDVHCDPHCSLDRAANVVPIPRNTLRNVRVDSTAKEEASRIFDVRVLGRDEHDKANDRRDIEPNHENSSSPESVGSKPTSDAQEAGHDIGWNRHKLRFFVRIVKCLDDRRQEEGEGVQRSVDASASLATRRWIYP
jgi:hypothetical protein